MKRIRFRNRQIKVRRREYSGKGGAVFVIKHEKKL